MFNIQAYHDYFILTLPLAVKVGITDKEKEYIIKKNEYLIMLISEMESKGLLNRISELESKKNVDWFSQSLKNFEEIKNLYLQLIKLIEGTSGESIVLTHSNGTLNATATQIIILMGIIYGASCELMKSIFSPFVKLHKKTNVTGLGALIKYLKDQKIESLEFFDDIDTKVRNSFFHFDFKFSDKKIYCNNNSILWREDDSEENDHITLSELLLLLNRVDRSLFCLMTLSTFFLKETTMNQGIKN